MSLVWDKVIPLSEKLLKTFNGYIIDEIDTKYKDNNLEFGWHNYVFRSQQFRQAHIQIVDAREFKKIWVLHMTIFPNTNDPSPIFGFDIVCGANKITGVFHDFSKIGDCWLDTYFQAKKLNLGWENSRKLPDWALEIFSPGMVAVGNVNTEEELDRLEGIVIDNLNEYLYNVGKTVDNDNYIEKQNRYCHFQKQNPHTPAMMINFGVKQDVFMEYMDKILFPEIK
jgi:hypothetical protein